MDQSEEIAALKKKVQSLEEENSRLRKQADKESKLEDPNTARNYRLTIVDFDGVDISNLHRQIIHRTDDVDMNKAESARKAVYDLNPSVRCDVVKEPLTSTNAVELISDHDCIVDASDNPQTRYMVNDACVIAKKVLVSGSAIGTEGQLSVYNFAGGPCYRCLYPKPNTREGSKSCSDHGVLGPVPGLIGVLQAVEVIKVLTGIGEVLSDRICLYDALECSFLRIKKPPKQPKCAVCGTSPTITSMSESTDASKDARGPSCQGPFFSPIPLPESQQITPQNYESLLKRDEGHVLLDVRVPEQFDICRLDNAINVELSDLEKNIGEIEALSGGEKPIVCVCRRGVLSATATEMLNELKSEHPKIHSAVNLKGGLDAWRKQVDTSFPKY